MARTAVSKTADGGSNPSRVAKNYRRNSTDQSAPFRPGKLRVQILPAVPDQRKVAREVMERFAKPWPRSAAQRFDPSTFRQSVVAKRHAARQPGSGAIGRHGRLKSGLLRVRISPSRPSLHAALTATGRPRELKTRAHLCDPPFESGAPHQQPSVLGSMDQSTGLLPRGLKVRVLQDAPDNLDLAESAERLAWD